MTSLQRATLKKIAEVSYDKKNHRPPVIFNNNRKYHLVDETPTVVIYKDEGKTPDGKDFYLVGVRGTADARDVKADIELINNLPGSKRYKDDFFFLQSFFKSHPGPRSVYGIGHSLGGAIIDSLMEAKTPDGQPLINHARSYNPAVQPKHIRMRSPNHKRVYNSNDPLYNLFGVRLLQKPEIRTADYSFGRKLLRNLPMTAAPTRLVDSLQAHRLENIGAGVDAGKKNTIDNMMKESGIPLPGDLDNPEKEYVEMDDEEDTKTTGNIPLPDDLDNPEKDYVEMDSAGARSDPIKDEEEQTGGAIGGEIDTIEDAALFKQIIHDIGRIKKPITKTWRFNVVDPKTKDAILLERIEKLTYKKQKKPLVKV